MKFRSSLCIIFLFLISCEDPGVELNNAELRRIVSFEKVHENPESDAYQKIRYSFKTPDLKVSQICDSAHLIGKKVYKEIWVQDDPENHPKVYRRIGKPLLIDLNEGLDQVCNQEFDMVGIIDLENFGDVGGSYRDLTAFFQTN